MKGRVTRPRGSQGFSLAELVLALLIFEIGLLAVAGMILTAQRDLGRSALLLRGTMEALRVGDSILEAGAAGGGELEVGWGKICWAALGTQEEGIRIWALAPDGADTLAAFRLLPPPGQPPREGSPE